MAQLSDAARQVLVSAVTRHAPLAEAELARLLTGANERVLPKGAALLNAGEQALMAGVVVDGALGEFYEDPEGRRKAKWLAGRGEAVGSTEDLVRDAPARSSIIALSKAHVVVVPYRHLRQLACERPAWARFYVAFMEDLYRRKSEREYALLMLRAAPRYAWFRERHGALEALLSQEIVASYLGITPVHLSRIRVARARAPV